MVTSPMLKALTGLLFILVVLYGFNIATTAGMLTTLQEQIREAKPAELELITLTDPSCPSCFNPAAVIEQLKKADAVTVVKEDILDASSKQGTELIHRMGIQNVPTVVVLGDVNKAKARPLWENGWTQAGDGVFFEAVLPPYRDVGTGEVFGLAELTELTDSSCTNCFDFGQIIGFLGRAGVGFSARKTVDISSPDGQSLVAQFSLQKAPALIVSNSLKAYPQLSGFLAQSLFAENGNYIVFEPFPPYRNISTGAVRGLVSVVYLNDSSCQNCYDVTLNKQILKQFGIVPVDEKIRDISSPEGQQLLSRYSITRVPTILLSPDAGEYHALSQAWAQVGSVEDDGWFILRKPSQLGTIHDLDAPSSGSAVTEIDVKGTEFSFTPSQLAVNAGDAVRLTFTNAGGAVHDFSIEGMGVKTQRLAPGNSETIEFTPAQAGTFKFVCTVPGHKEAGMTGQLVVE